MAFIQAASLAQERELLSSQRVTADALAQLTEQVKSAAAHSLAREHKALITLEKGGQDKAAMLDMRESIVGEREEAVG